MKFHFIGDEPYPTPYKASSTVHETSLAVLQFVELARGERTVMRPHNLFRVEAVRAEEHYCLHCFGVHWFDVVYSSPLIVGGWPSVKVKRCRHCGTESGG
jgi:hypothetical protein